MWILVLIMVGVSARDLPKEYPTEEACHKAGKAFSMPEPPPNIFPRNSRDYRCIPAPEVK